MILPQAVPTSFKVLGDDDGDRRVAPATRLPGGLLVSKHERLIHSNAAFVAETLVNRRAFVASRVRHQQPTKPSFRTIFLWRSALVLHAGHPNLRSYDSALLGPTGACAL